MASACTRAPPGPVRREMSPPRQTISKAELDALIEEATVDCYNEEEQVTGLFTMLEEHLALPFQTTVLGLSVTVTHVDLTANDQIVRSAAATVSSRRSRSSICRCPRRHPTARNGSRHTAAGTAEARQAHQPSRSRSDAHAQPRSRTDGRSRPHRRPAAAAAQAHDRAQRRHAPAARPAARCSHPSNTRGSESVPPTDSQGIR